MIRHAKPEKLTGRDWLLIAFFPVNLLLQVIGFLMLEAAKVILWLAGKILRL